MVTLKGPVNVEVLHTASAMRVEHSRDLVSVLALEHPSALRLIDRKQKIRSFQLSEVLRSTYYTLAIDLFRHIGIHVQVYRPLGHLTLISST